VFLQNNLATLFAPLIWQPEKRGGEEKKALFAVKLHLLRKAEEEAQNSELSLSLSLLSHM